MYLLEVVACVVLGADRTDSCDALSVVLGECGGEVLAKRYVEESWDVALVGA